MTRKGGVRQAPVGAWDLCGVALAVAPPQWRSGSACAPEAYGVGLGGWASTPTTARVQPRTKRALRTSNKARTPNLNLEQSAHACSQPATKRAPLGSVPAPSPLRGGLGRGLAGEQPRTKRAQPRTKRAS